MTLQKTIFSESDQPRASAPPHFVIVGHEGCHNRGCEALVRTIVMVLSRQWPQASFSVVSSFPEHDAPLMEFERLDVFPAVGVLSPLLQGTPRRSLATKVLSRVNRFAKLCSLAQAQRSAPEPCPVKEEDFRRTRQLEELYKSATAVIATGGDTFIEDYGPPYMAMEQIEFAQFLKIPTIIWGASIWPLKTHWIEERIRAMLAKCTLVSVRDDATVQYLSGLGISHNVVKVADGAFLMPAKKREPDRFLGAVKGKLLVGFNGSSLISNYLAQNECRRVIGDMAAIFDEAIERQNAALLLIPHDGPPGAREREFLFEFRQLMKQKQQAFLLPAGLNAVQTKFIIGQLDIFIPMRFHPSIAAISQGVPTLGLSHSPKFAGLHDMVFNHRRFLLPYHEINRESLREKMAQILKESDQIRNYLATQIPELQKSAWTMGQHTAKYLSLQ